MEQDRYLISENTSLPGFSPAALMDGLFAARWRKTW
jgi:hypothetical protein